MSLAPLLGLAAARAATRATGPQITELEGEVQHAADLHQRGNRRDTLQAQHAAAAALVRAAASPQLSRLLVILAPHCRRAENASAVNLPALFSAPADLRKVLRAVRASDTAAAGEAAEALVNVRAKRVLALLD